MTKTLLAAAAMLAAHRHAGHRWHDPRDRWHGHRRLDASREALVRKLLFTGVAALSLLLAGAAVAGSCMEYCGVFAGIRWCQTRCR
jgi:hypothetical protein